MIEVGSFVAIKEPFFEFFPEESYVVTGISETGAFQILGGIDFDVSFLEEVTV